MKKIKKESGLLNFSDEEITVLMKYCADDFFENMRRSYVNHIEELEKKIILSLQKEKKFSKQYEEKKNKDKDKDHAAVALPSMNFLLLPLFLKLLDEKSKIEKKALLKNNSIRKNFFLKKVKENLSKYANLFEILLKNEAQSHEEPLLTKEIDFIENIKIEKKEEEIKKIIPQKEQGIVEKVWNFIKAWIKTSR
ncbi:hypothetical protein [Holospora undulata]|uniref:hypothetical protein n=1 Tax=Holospora undulata TaxID=1169117 RepID=UPI001269787B|nr:hypothetical protein [Holospora undulata]